jgi:hypothetical protein
MSLPAASAAATTAFRSTFHFTENVNWFPGHMLKSMRELGERLKMCHAVLEVRDARVCLRLRLARSGRFYSPDSPLSTSYFNPYFSLTCMLSLLFQIPISSANSSLNSIIQGKRRVIFFNKSDLVDAPHVRALAARFEVAGARCVFGSTLDANCAPKILDSLTHAILQTPAPRIDPAAAFAHPKYCAKSSTDAPNESRQSQSGTLSPALQASERECMNSIHFA